jgi:hypothetical protein
VNKVKVRVPGQGLYLVDEDKVGAWAPLGYPVVYIDGNEYPA